MSSAIEIACPNCDQPLKVPEAVLGKKIKCKHCSHAFVAEVQPTMKTKGVKPSKPGGASVKAKKELESPPPPPPPPKKRYEDDDDDGVNPNPFGVITEEDVPRCPFCAMELDPPDAKICLHCGFNNLTRERPDVKKVWAPDANDWMAHLGPGIIALIGFILLVVLDIVVLLNMRDWITGTFLQKEEKGADGDIAFYVKPGAFITLIWAATVLPVIGFARFAVKRLLIDNKPMEKAKK